MSSAEISREADALYGVHFFCPNGGHYERFPGWLLAARLGIAGVVALWLVVWLLYVRRTGCYTQWLAEQDAIATKRPPASGAPPDAEEPADAEVVGDEAAAADPSGSTDPPGSTGASDDAQGANGPDDT
ncbi:unnamed protein product, partial [marine sediment metagenome]